MNPFLDPAPAAAAGAAHGQLASATTSGGLVLTCAKIVEDGARALILLAPGLFRMDVRPVQDSLQVVSRALHDVPARWGTVESPEESGTGREYVLDAERLTWMLAIDLEPTPITARIELRMTTDRPSRASHFAAFALIKEGSAETFAEDG